MQHNFISVSTDPVPSTSADLYLDLLKRTLTRAVVAHEVERHTLRPWGVKSKLLCKLNALGRGSNLEVVRLVKTTTADYMESGREAQRRAEDAETMLGIRQLDQMQRCILDVLDRGVPGDLLEAGVWRGGMTILMRAVLKSRAITDRKVWVVDSFAGLPAIDRTNETFAWEEGNLAVSLDEVQANFARYGLLDDQVVFLKGYFCDTLPNSPIGKLAVLRVDADLYSSTMDVLRTLYSRLSVGGYAVFDDYQNLPDCRRAIDEFRQENGILEEIVRIDERAVYWKKLV